MKIDSTPLISIIIPVYNVEPYLTDSINSVLDQSLKNYEIILINDGSTDNSLTICKSFQEKYDNIKLLNQSNKGLSATRNRGINEAKGKYIAFLDSDDLLHRDFLKILIENIGNSDMAICKIKIFQDGEIITTKDNKKANIKILSGKEMNEFLYNPVYGATTIMPNNKLFKKDLWENFSFPINKLHEDCYTIYKLIDKSNKVTFIDNELFFYRRRKNSLTSVRIFKSLKDEYDAASEQINFFTERSQLNIVKNANRFRKSLFLNSTLDPNWSTWKEYTIYDILKDDLRTSMKIKLIKKKISNIFKTKIQ